MTAKRKILFTCVILGLALTIAASLLPLMARTSNCGGNSYALAACKQVVLYLQTTISTNALSFNPSLLDSFDQTNLFSVANSHWTVGAGYLVRTNNFQPAAQRQIIAACDTVYDNVPQPTLWNFYRRNPMHAVAFSDGTTGLISPIQFTEIDLGNFLDLTRSGNENIP